MFLFFLALLALLSPAPPPELFRALDFDGAVAAAKTEHKYVLAVFTRTGVSDAKRLDTTTWIDPKVREWIGLEAVAIKLDVDKHDDVATKLRIHTVPTIVFMSEAGSEIDRISGYVDGRTFMVEMKAILLKGDPLERARRRFDAQPNDPHRRIDVAMVLADRAEFAGALEHLLWCWDQGVAADPSFAEARRTFLLRELMRLARLHPKAADALAARARALYDKVTACTAPEADVADFLLLNHELQQDDRTLAAFDAVAANSSHGDESPRPATEGQELDPGSEACAAMRDRLAPLIVNPLIDARRYAEAIERLGDPRAHFNKLVANFRDESDRLTLERPNEAFVAIDVNRRAVRNEAARIYEALAGAKKFDDADSFAKLVVLFDGRGATYCALIVAALRVEAHGPAKAIVTRALADPKLTNSEKEDVRKLSRAIIQPK